MNKILAAGALMVAAGMALVVLGVAGQGGGSAGGFILIGPFPIVFGTGSNGGELALLSVLVGAVMLAALLLVALRFRALTDKGNEEINK